MRKIKDFEVFGIKYKTLQFSAIEALDMMQEIDICKPIEILKYTKVISEDGTETKLDSEKTINDCVKDKINHIPPKLVLNAIIKIVTDFNFDFLKDWKGVKIPPRFLSDATSIESTYMEPIVSSVINNGLSDYKDLENYYSIKDLFSMFDSLVVKSVNAAYAQEHEAAELKSKKR